MPPRVSRRPPMRAQETQHTSSRRLPGSRLFRTRQRLPQHALLLERKEARQARSRPLLEAMHAVEGNAGEAVAEVRRGGGDPLRVGALECVAAVL